MLEADAEDDEQWMNEDWDKWIAMGCPDNNGITVPAGPASAVLDQPPPQHRPQSVLVAPNTDLSVGLRDPDDSRLWPDLFYQWM